MELTRCEVKQISNDLPEIAAELFGTMELDPDGLDLEVNLPTTNQKCSGVLWYF